MILYHFSNGKFGKLSPQYGDNRHAREDSSSVNKGGIFLTTSPCMYKESNVSAENFF